VSINLEQFSKYSKPGPRYTSYPTALEFSEDFKYESYLGVMLFLPLKRISLADM